jgi:methyl-accepting chemotaxis protein
MNVLERLPLSTKLTLVYGLLATPIAVLATEYGSALAVGLKWGIAGAGLIGAAAVLLLTMSAEARSRATAISAAKRLAAGDLDAPVDMLESDPLSSALGQVREALRSKSLDNSRSDTDVTRIRVALDKVASNVMVADADGEIVYMNEAVTAMFRSNATQIRTQLPNFDPERVLGSNFDGFHKMPSHQRNLLGSLRGTHTVEIRLGTSVLKIIGSPVVDSAGQRLGTVVQWVDRSAEVSTEAEVQTVVKAASDGDLSQRISMEGKSGFFASLATGINSLLDTTSTLVREVQQATGEVSGSADEISKGNMNLSQRTEEQASSLEETASSMEQMTSTVRQNADNAAQANQLAAAARLQAEKGGAVVSEAVAAMQGINAASSKIADIIGVIDEIAFQTNLLALNAAVEAARAGEQGRGFAVVASEVRSLASRSAEAAKEIKGLIQDSVGKVAQGSKLVDQSGQTLSEIVASVKKVTDIVSEIAAASQEQASGIDQVNKAVTSMDEVTQQNAALVEQAAAAAESLMDQAQQLNDMMARYNVGGEQTARARAVARPHPPKTSQPPAAPDRRTPNRPWAKSKPAASDPAKRMPVTGRPRAHAPAAAADWNEF